MIGEICLFMKTKTTPPVLFSAEEVYNFFFSEHVCRISLDVPMHMVYYLDQMACDGDKIILINVNQENSLFDDGFVCNGTKAIELDNLSHIFVQKYIKEWDNHSICEITDLDFLVDENCKYSNFLADLIVQTASIEQISSQKISEILNLFLGIDIPRQRVHDLFDRKIDEYTRISIKELQEEILNGNIEFSGIIHYDEEYLWIKHQPYVRLTILDAENKLIIEDTVIPRHLFSKNYIKIFLETSLIDLTVETIITDGYHAYSGIIEELGYNHQRCTFHSMKNLMDKVMPKHWRINRKIKSLNNKIDKINKKIEEIEEKYKGKVGRTPKNDTQRIKDNELKRELKKELSSYKAKIRKYKKILDEDDKLIKEISSIFKTKNYTTAKNKFKRLYDRIEELPEEFQKYLKNLSKYLEKALQHTIDNRIPRTNNLIESFYKATLPRKVKKTFKTYRGLMNRITLNNIRWIKRCATTSKN